MVTTATGGKVDVSTDGGVTYFNIPEVRKWTLRYSKNAKQYASSSTGGGKRKLAGAEDFEGSIDVYHDLSSTLRSLGVIPGTSLFFKLYEMATSFYIAPSYVDDVNKSVDIEGEGIIEGAVTFSRDGTLVFPV
jgi:hypothetical protein